MWKTYNFNKWKDTYTVRSYADESYKGLETLILGPLPILAQIED